MEALFPGTYPVLVSSGRAGIVLSLCMMGLRRPDYVGIGPYSSACIFQSVGDVSTPVPGNLAAPFSAQLVYHQWGYVHSVREGSAVVEDSVDSLCISSAALFPNGGRAEILSLSKLLGIGMGGVVLCRYPEDAETLRELRDQRRHMAWPQVALCVLARHLPWASVLWHRGESGNGPLPDTVCGLILRRLESWNVLIADRREKIELTASLRPSWLKSSSFRLPCVIPIECSPEMAARLIMLGLTSDLRHFNRTQDQSQWNLVKVLPLPIHQDVPMELLAKAVDIVMAQNRKTIS